MLCWVISHCVVLCSVMLGYITLCCVVSCNCVELYHIVLCSVMLGYITLCCVVSCCVGLYHIVLCSVMLCWVVSHCAGDIT